MTTTQTVLLVAGTAVGAFVLLKVLSPSGPALTTKAPRSNTDLISVNSLIGLGSGLAGLFGGGSSSGGSSQPTAADLGRINFDTNNYTTSQGFEFTDASGNFIAG